MTEKGVVRSAPRKISRNTRISMLVFIILVHLGLFAGREYHDQVHMDVAETNNVDLVVSHHKGFGPDEIDVQRAVDKARMAGKDQKAEYKKFLEEEVREHDLMKEKK